MHAEFAQGKRSMNVNPVNQSDVPWCALAANPADVGVDGGEDDNHLHGER